MPGTTTALNQKQRTKRWSLKKKKMMVISSEKPKKEYS